MPSPIPISAATTLPAISAHGWANGLDEATNTSTADAPAGPMICRVSGVPTVQ